MANLRSAWTPERAAVGAAVSAAVRKCTETVFVKIAAPTVGFDEVAAVAAVVRECAEIAFVEMVARTVGFDEAAAVAAAAETTGF